MKAKISNTKRPATGKRPAGRIANFEIVKEKQRNIAKRLRQAIQIKPDMSVSEFLHQSKFKPVENKQIVELINKHFGTLSIKELKTYQINYFFGIYSTDPIVRAEVIKQINADPLRREYRTIIQRIDFMNKYRENNQFRKKVSSALKNLAETKVARIFGKFELRQLNSKEPELKFLKKYCMDLSYDQIRELIKDYSNI